jgi:hypothetical protein
MISKFLFERGKKKCRKYIKKEKRRKMQERKGKNKS